MQPAEVRSATSGREHGQCRAVSGVSVTGFRQGRWRGLTYTLSLSLPGVVSASRRATCVAFLFPTGRSTVGSRYACFGGLAVSRIFHIVLSFALLTFSASKIAVLMRFRLLSDVCSYTC